MLDDAVEEKAGGEKVRIGMVVRDRSRMSQFCRDMLTGSIKVIRGNSVVMLEVRRRLYTPAISL